MNVQSRIREPQAAAAGLKARAKGKARRRLVTIAVLLGAVLAGTAYYFYGRPAETAGAPIIVTAERGNVENLVTALGSLQPLTSVDVGAQVSGQLKTLSVMIGDDVEKDRLLAEIDSAVMAARVDAGNANLQNLQAQLGERQAQLALAQAQAERQARLMADNATSQEALDLAQATLKSAEAQVKSVQAQINQSQSTLKADQATLGYSKIFAPMAGTVTAIPAKQGQTLNANQQTPTILTIADLKTMTVSTQVSEADVPKLRIGMEAYFTTLGSGEQRWTGKLRQILPTPTVVNNVVLYTALFDVANPNKQLMPQMTAQVFFVLSAAHDAVTVPVAAVQYTGGGQGARGGRRGNGAADGATQPTPAQAEAEAVRTRPATVTIVKDDGTEEMRNVQVGVTDRVKAAIVSGLAEGERVVAGVESPGGGGGPAANGRGNAGPGRGRGAVLFGG